MNRPCLVLSLGLIILTPSAVFPSDFYWSRPWCKGRVAVGVGADGGSLLDPPAFAPFADGDSDDTGEVIEEDNGLLNLSASATIAPSGGGVVTNLLILGSLALNAACQADTTSDIIFSESQTARAGADEFDDVGYNWLAVMEARHQLCSDVHPSGTHVGGVCKIIINWAITDMWCEQYCDWVIFGFPGEPYINMDGHFLIVNYWDTIADEYVEHTDYLDGPSDAGGVYVDVPAILTTGDIVEWVAFTNYGGNALSNGYNSYSGPHDDAGGGMWNIKIWMQTDDNPGN